MMKHSPLILLAALGLAAVSPVQAQKPVKAEDAVAKATPKASPDNLVRVGDRVRAGGDPAAALGFYQRALDMDSANRSALRAAASLLMDGGAPGAAETYWRRLLVVDPGDGGARLELARALNSRAAPEEALALLADLPPKAAPADAVASEKGLALDLLGRPADAQMAYGDALQSGAGRNDEVRIRLAISFALTGDYRTASQLLQQIVNTPGAEEKGRRVLGLVGAMSGDLEGGARVATLGKPEQEAAALLPFYRRLAGLPPRELAAAAHLGLLPTVAAPVVVPEQAPPPAAPVPATEPVPADAAWVQLGAFATVEQARGQFAAMQKAQPDLLGNAVAAVSPIAGFNRLVIGPLPPGVASALATQLKARGVAAILRREALSAIPLAK